jgi:hypothetical protein
MNLNAPNIRYLIELVQITHCEKSLDVLIQLDYNVALKKLVDLTQTLWIRPKGTERWDLEDSSFLTAQRNKIVTLLNKLGFVDEIQPSCTNYESILILGASDTNLSERINYVKKIWHLGVCFKSCYLLTGGFELNKVLSKEPPTTDTNLIIQTYEQLSQSWPCALRNKEVIPIIAKNKLTRPNTKDTFSAWLEKKLPASSVLVISNQPFIPYQNLIAKKMLKTNYQYETVGYRLNPNMNIAIILDSVARYLYEYNVQNNID